MPCYSTIRTQMTDGARLIDALKELGYSTEQAKNGDIHARKDGNLTVFMKGTAYSARGVLYGLDDVGRKYAELGVREYARMRGFGVIEEEGQTLTLVNRRG